MTVKIIIKRSRHLFLYTRSEDGVIVANEQLIDANRARQIIEANPNGRAIAGIVDLDHLRPSWWTWCVGIQASAN